MRNGLRARRPRDERGSVSPLGVAMVIALLFALAFCVDLSAAMATSARNNEYIQTARETVEQTGSGFLIKNADNPFKELSRQVVDSLRNQGYEGYVFVIMTEAPKGYSPTAGKTLPDDRRVIGYSVWTSAESPSVFAKLMGKDGQEIFTTKTMSTVLYSSGECWRPMDEIYYLSNSRGVYVAGFTAYPGSSEVEDWGYTFGDNVDDDDVEKLIAATKNAMDSRSDAYR